MSSTMMLFANLSISKLAIAFSFFSFFSLLRRLLFHYTMSEGRHSAEKYDATSPMSWILRVNSIAHERNLTRLEHLLPLANLRVQQINTIGSDHASSLNCSAYFKFKWGTVMAKTRLNTDESIEYAGRRGLGRRRRQ